MGNPERIVTIEYVLDVRREPPHGLWEVYYFLRIEGLEGLYLTVA